MQFLDFFRRPRESEKDVAAQRLRLILAHDRANISPGMLEMLKDEIIAVIAKHLQIDPQNVNVKFTEDQREARLVADIPLSNSRKERTTKK